MCILSVYIAKTCWLLWFECSVYVSDGFPKKQVWMEGGWVGWALSNFSLDVWNFCNLANPLNLQQVPPCFPPELWNVHEATVNGAPPTNNSCEGWNNRFFTFSLVTIIAQDLIGQPPRKRIRRQYVSLQTHFLVLCQDRVTGRRTIDEFLELVFSNFHIVGFCPLFMLWDFVLWDFVLWDFVRRDFVLWDSVPDSSLGPFKCYLMHFSWKLDPPTHPLVTLITLNLTPS